MDSYQDTVIETMRPKSFSEENLKEQTIKIHEYGEAVKLFTGEYAVWFLDPITKERDYFLDNFATIEEGKQAIDERWRQVCKVMIGFESAKQKAAKREEQKRDTPPPQWRDREEIGFRVVQCADGTPVYVKEEIDETKVWVDWFRDNLEEQMSEIMRSAKPGDHNVSSKFLKTAIENVIKDKELPQPTSEQLEDIEAAIFSSCGIPEKFLS